MTSVKRHTRKVGRKRVKVKAHKRKTKRKAITLTNTHSMEEYEQKLIDEYGLSIEEAAKKRRELQNHRFFGKYYKTNRSKAAKNDISHLPLDVQFDLLMNMDKKKAKRSMSKLKVFRGRRPGSDEGGFFATDELFARTYGPVDETEINLENPKEISSDEWKDSFGLWDIMGDKEKKELTKKYTSKGHDSVTSNFKTIGEPIKVIWKKRTAKRSKAKPPEGWVFVDWEGISGKTWKDTMPESSFEMLKQSPQIKIKKVQRSKTKTKRKSVLEAELKDVKPVDKRGDSYFVGADLYNQKGILYARQGLPVSEDRALGINRMYKTDRLVPYRAQRSKTKRR